MKAGLTSLTSLVPSRCAGRTFCCAEPDGTCLVSSADRLRQEGGGGREGDEDGQFLADGESAGTSGPSTCPWCGGVLVLTRVRLCPQEKDLVPKLFKVLAPRFEARAAGYTRMARVPNRANLDRAKMAVLEYRGNPLPPLPPLHPGGKPNQLWLLNQLLEGYRQEAGQGCSA